MWRGYYTVHEGYVVMRQLLEVFGVFTLLVLVALLVGALLTRRPGE